MLDRDATLADYIGHADILGAPNIAFGRPTSVAARGQPNGPIGDASAARFVAALAHQQRTSNLFASESTSIASSEVSGGRGGAFGFSPNASISRIPAGLLQLGTPSTFTPGDAAKRRAVVHAEASSNLNRSWKASSLSQPYGGPASQALQRPDSGGLTARPTTPNRSTNSVALRATSPSTGNSKPRAASGKSIEQSTEARAQEFYRRLEVAAERELAVASIKTPLMHGIVVGRERNALQYAKVSLKEPGLATQRLKQLNERLFDHMLSETVASAETLKQHHRLFHNPINAAHVALYQTAAGPSTTIASGHGALAATYVSSSEYNPYFPKATEHIGRPAAAFVSPQPLVVAIAGPDDDANPTSPVKGAVGTLALAAPTSRGGGVRGADQQVSESHSHLWGPALPATTAHPHAVLQHEPQEHQDEGASSALSECLLTPDDQALLLHACTFVVSTIATISGHHNNHQQRVHLFSSPREFHEVIGVSEGVASKLLAQMGEQRSDWDSLQRGSTEHTIVLRLVERLFTKTTSWYLPTIRLPSGNGVTSKLKVSELHRKLRGA